MHPKLYQIANKYFKLSKKAHKIKLRIRLNKKTSQALVLITIRLLLLIIKHGESNPNKRKIH